MMNQFGTHKGRNILEFHVRVNYSVNQNHNKIHQNLHTAHFDQSILNLLFITIEYFKFLFLTFIKKVNVPGARSIFVYLHRYLKICT